MIVGERSTMALPGESTAITAASSTGEGVDSEPPQGLGVGLNLDVVVEAGDWSGVGSGVGSGGHSGGHSGALALEALFQLVEDAVEEGQKLAFDRGKGNCLTCHDIKGGNLPGSIGPALTNIKSKYPDRNELVAILVDATKRNPLTVMPPFGRNRILNDKEINAIVDFLQTL